MTIRGERGAAGPNAMALVLDAARFAAVKHRAQKRKGVDGTPYINHPIEVAALLAHVAGVTDPVILAAALLHDTIEDTRTTADELRRHFGEAVAAIVLETTDDKSLPKAVRKRLQIEHAPHLSDGARLVKIADKICNIRDVSQHPPNDWSQIRRRAYLRWADAVVAGLRGVNDALDRCYDEERACAVAWVEGGLVVLAGPVAVSGRTVRVVAEGSEEAVARTEELVEGRWKDSGVSVAAVYEALAR